jgi:hypothetical protein
MTSWIIAAVLCAAPARAAAPKPKAAKSAEKIMEWKGQAGPSQPGTEIALDAKAWAGLWKRLGQDAPTLDFKRFAAAAVFIGDKPTGGFGIEFQDPQKKVDDLLVRYRVLEPTGMVTEAFTQPWAIRAYPRPKGKILIEEAAR